MTTVLLVRHGRTGANASGQLAGRSPGVRLDERGEQQVVDLGSRMSALRLDLVVSSPLERARQTAEAILVGQGRQAGRRRRPDGDPGRGAAGPRPLLEVDDRVSECDYGSWTGGELRTLAKDPLWKVVQSHPSAVTFPEGESLAQMQARAVAAIRYWNERVGPRGIYAVVSHGDIIKSILADALGMHLDQFQRIHVDPASVSVVRYTETRPFVLRTNDVGGDLAGFAAPRRRGRRSSDAAVGGGSGSG